MFEIFQIIIFVILAYYFLKISLIVINKLVNEIVIPAGRFFIKLSFWIIIIGGSVFFLLAKDIANNELPRELQLSILVVCGTLLGVKYIKEKT
jgi:di/tricarboxylate transporter